MKKGSIVCLIMITMLLITSCSAGENAHGAEGEFKPSSFEFENKEYDEDERINTYDTLLYYGRSLAHDGELGYFPEFHLSEDEILGIYNNEKLMCTYLTEEMEELSGDQMFLEGIFNSIVYNDDDLRKTMLYKLNEDDYGYQGCEVLSDSNLITNGDRAYRYVIAETEHYGRVIIYFLYSNVDGEWQEHCYWGVSEKVNNCSISDVEGFSLMDRSVSEDFSYFGILDINSSNNRVSKLFIDNGQMATVVYEPAGYTSGMADYYICAAVEVCKLSVFDVLKEEHMPEKLFEEFAEQGK